MIDKEPASWIPSGRSFQVSMKEGRNEFQQNCLLQRIGRISTGFLSSWQKGGQYCGVRSIVAVTVLCAAEGSQFLNTVLTETNWVVARNYAQRFKLDVNSFVFFCLCHVILHDIRIFKNGTDELPVTLNEFQGLLIERKLQRSKTVYHRPCIVLKYMNMCVTCPCT